MSRRRPHRDLPARTRTARPIAEVLEGRAVQAVFHVNSLADVLTPPPGVVTLRSALQQANANPGGDTIDLDVPGIYKYLRSGPNDAVVTAILLGASYAERV